ncbi:MAG: hypothetical protein J6M12_07710 [Clostridia bacterium]|nr:hypothetical protein [Clostridia bacterium]
MNKERSLLSERKRNVSINRSVKEKQIKSTHFSKVFEGFQGTFYKKSPEWGSWQSPEYPFTDCAPLLSKGERFGLKKQKKEALHLSLRICANIA